MIGFSGGRGELRAGYQVAAQLGTWNLGFPTEHFSDGCWTLTAEMLARDVFWLHHAGELGLWLDMGKTWWVWRSVSVECGMTTVTVSGAGGPQDVPK